MRPPLVVIAMFAAFPACTPDHQASDAGSSDAGPTDTGPTDTGPFVDGTRHVVDLTDAEWMAVCTWAASIARSETYYCQGTTYLGEVDGCGGCTFYDWSVSTCMDAGTRTYWRGQPATCAVTVAEFVACMRTLAEPPCSLAYMPSAECVTASCAP